MMLFDSNEKQKSLNRSATGAFTLSRKYILKTVVKISRVPLDRFYLSYRAYIKKYYLLSQESFFEKILLFIKKE